MRNGVRIGDLQFFEDFKSRFRALVEYAERAHGNSLNVDVEKEIAYYESVRERVSFLFFELCFLMPFFSWWRGGWPLGVARASLGGVFKANSAPLGCLFRGPRTCVGLFAFWSFNRCGFVFLGLRVVYVV